MDYLKEAQIKKNAAALLQVIYENIFQPRLERLNRKEELDGPLAGKSKL